MAYIFVGRKFLVSVIVLVIAIIWRYNGIRKINGPIVETQYGKIQGLESFTRGGKKVHEFRQIPFAQPPVDNLRFEPPEPPIPWKGVRDATKPGPQCLQLNQITSSVDGSEGCLYLNLFVPASRKELLPVMVYIHGGAFISGSANLYNPAYLLDENIILVTTNYRLASLGFLNTGDKFARGNQGLKDQNLALKWVQNNIKRFGGDPQQVTLFGESSGAMSVGFHLFSQMSKGLFSRAIMQSGSPLGNWALNRDTLNQAKRFARKFNCPDTDNKEMVSCLKKIDGTTLMQAHQEVLSQLREKVTLFLPSIETIKDEETFLANEPVTLLKTGQFTKVPLITGVTEHEGLLVSAVIISNQTFLQYANDNWDTFAARTLDYDPRKLQVSKQIREFYFPGAKSIASANYLDGFTNMFGDRKFFVPVHQFAKEYQNHAPVRLYVYSYSAEVSLGDMLAASQNEWLPPIVSVLLNMAKRWIARTVLGNEIPHLGICHADELQLLFNWQLSSYISKDHKDYGMSRKLVKLWADFAKSKSKLIVEDVEWPPLKISDARFQYLNISTKSAIIEEPFTKRIQFWESLEI